MSVDDLSEYERGVLLSGMTPGSAGMMLGRSAKWVEEMRTRLAKPVQPMHQRRVDWERVKALYLEPGGSAKSVAEQLTAEGTPISNVGVRKIILKLGVPLKTKRDAHVAQAAQLLGRRPGGKPALVEEKVDEIVRLYTVEELGSYQIAARVGVDPSTVKRYLKLRNVTMRDRTRKPQCPSSSIAQVRKPRSGSTATAPKASAATPPSPRSQSNGASPSKPASVESPASSESRFSGDLSGSSDATPARSTSGTSAGLSNGSGAIPERVLRYCRWFDRARWPIRSIAHLFDLKPDELARALGH